MGRGVAYENSEIHRRAPARSRVCRRSDAPHSGGPDVIASEWVALYFHDDGRKCADCGYCKSWTEGHGERMAECDAIAKGVAEECPAWIEERDGGIAAITEGE